MSKETESQRAKGLYSLPPELFISVCGYMDNKSFGRFLRTCRGIHAFGKDDMLRRATEDAFAPQHEYDKFLIVHGNREVHCRSDRCPKCTKSDPVVEPTYSFSRERLLRAALIGDCDTVEKYLAAGVDPNFYTLQPLPLLYQLCVAHSYQPDKILKTLKLLLKYGADPNLPFGQDKTLLDYVGRQGFYIAHKKAKLLLHAGAKFTTTSGFGALCKIEPESTSRHRGRGIWCLQQAIRNGSDLFNLEHDMVFPQPALYYRPTGIPGAPMSLLHIAVTYGKSQTVQLLLDHVPHLMDTSTGEVLCEALVQEDKEMAIFLLKKGVSIKNVAPNVKNPLPTAIDIEAYDAMQMILDHPDLDLSDNDVALGMESAFCSEYYEFMELLLHDPRFGHRFLRAARVDEWKEAEMVNSLGDDYEEGAENEFEHEFLIRPWLQDQRQMLRLVKRMMAEQVSSS
ncbi:ankyrin [Aspergillus heteromorphus CBS 117.55]|uniref:Ankyrin n=1 Tax=Aspergillus heteromorphus CBS 117.55 TaxID=1448321 RepID=A0A317VJE3_9EURO|nr:ankyrin [Aspergillus heteromorphus CBS 117.55]PWY72972.1 ankyrin [Aspergillus heteromorphus CBS 117.55]